MLERRFAMLVRLIYDASAAMQQTRQNPCFVGLMLIFVKFSMRATTERQNRITNIYQKIPYGTQSVKYDCSNTLPLLLNGNTA